DGSHLLAGSPGAAADSSEQTSNAVGKAGERLERMRHDGDRSLADIHCALGNAAGRHGDLVYVHQLGDRANLVHANRREVRPLNFPDSVLRFDRVGDEDPVADDFLFDFVLWPLQQRGIQKVGRLELPRFFVRFRGSRAEAEHRGEAKKRAARFHTSLSSGKIVESQPITRLPSRGEKDLGLGGCYLVCAEGGKFASRSLAALWMASPTSLGFCPLERVTAPRQISLWPRSRMSR